jgi:glycosyltransferase involved in cell wall biosynthesis
MAGCDWRAHPQNRGKGAAVRSGLALARAPVVVVQDADLEYDPAHFARLLAPILAGQAEVVYGSRFAPSALEPSSSRSFPLSESLFRKKVEKGC